MYHTNNMPNTQRILGPSLCYTFWLGAGFMVVASSVVIGILGNYYLFLDLFTNADRIVVKILLMITLNIMLYALLRSAAIPTYRYFAKYTVDENGFVLIMPTGKQTVYRWSSIVLADITFAYVNRQPKKYIRIFTNKYQVKNHNSPHPDLEYYLMHQPSVIVLEYSQERFDAIQQIIPIQDSTQK